MILVCSNVAPLKKEGGPHSRKIWIWKKKKKTSKLYLLGARFTNKNVKKTKKESEPFGSNVAPTFTIWGQFKWCTHIVKEAVIEEEKCKYNSHCKWMLCPSKRLYNKHYFDFSLWLKATSPLVWFQTNFYTWARTWSGYQSILTFLCNLLLIPLRSCSKKVYGSDPIRSGDMTMPGLIIQGCWG